jgi:hypothetical protein
MAERTYLLSSSVSAGPAAAGLLLSGSDTGVACDPSPAESVRSKLERAKQAHRRLQI